MIDADDEVRDLATFYYHILKNKDRSLVALYILEGSLRFTFIRVNRECLFFPHPQPQPQPTGFPYSLSALERALSDYLRMPSSERPFDVRAISVEEAPVRLLPGAPGAPAATSGASTLASSPPFGYCFLECTMWAHIYCPHIGFI